MRISKKNFLAGFLIWCGTIFSCSKPGDAIVQKGLNAMRKGEYDFALESFEKALQEETRYSEELICTFISQIFSLKNDLPNAILYQERALKNGGDYISFVTLGSALHLNNQDDRAIEIYQKAIDFDEKRPEAYAALGALWLGKNDAKKASECLEKAKSIAPNLSIVHANLALSYAKLGKIENAQIEIQKARELKCDNIEEFERRVAEELSKSSNPDF